MLAGVDEGRTVGAETGLCKQSGRRFLFDRMALTIIVSLHSERAHDWLIEALALKKLEKLKQPPPRKNSLACGHAPTNLAGTAPPSPPESTVPHWLS